MTTATTETTDPQDLPRRPLAALAVRLAALWLLAGAAFKLFQGTPNDLPRIVRDVPLELGLTYKLTITVELVVAFLALARPRWGWLPLAATLVVFDAILIGMLGDESCGCFGSQIEIAPSTMLAIDTALLVALLATRPWGMAPRRVPFALVAALVAAGIALPWLFDRQVEPGGVEVVGTDGTVRPVAGGWLELDVERWVGKSLRDTPLAKHVDLDMLITDGLWVLYRDTCDHCAEHLAHLAQTEVGERMLTLVRLREPNDTEANRVVNLMPEGGFVQRVELPETLTYVITTPGELVVERDTIVAAREGATVDGHE